MNDSQIPPKSFSSRAVVSTWHLAVGVLFLSSCTLMPSIAIIRDDRVERLIREEASKILAVTEDAANTSQYEIFLTDFPRADILGMSIGRRRIYVSYKLASRASFNQRHLWMLRQTLAHEIAHEIAGHANYRQVNFNRSSERGMSSRDVGLPWYVTFQPYSVEKELQADLDALRYWETLRWNCTIWVRILRDFERQNYSGDINHPTQTRLREASRACRSDSGSELVRSAFDRQTLVSSSGVKSNR